ncbi:MAG: hypothetical protein IIY54_10620 [Ruminococcus sp.]|nr:hypothetical protein [Ruminococcus sp.]MBQ1310151.1 hypothetical protein [Ruminococcus sp.]
MTPTKTKDGRFAAGDPRTAEAGRKGGKTPHATGSKTGKTYRYKGFEIAWDKRRHLWRATDGINTLYARSHHKMTEDIREFLNKQPSYIEAPVPGEENKK